MRWLERLVGSPDRPPDWKSRPVEYRVRVIAGEHFAEIPTATTGPAAWLEPEDSLHVVEFVLALEEEFGIEISDEDVETLHTLPEVVSYIQGRIRPN